LTNQPHLFDIRRWQASLANFQLQERLAMKRTRHGTFLVVAVMFLAWVGSGCSGAGGSPTTQAADTGIADSGTESTSDNDDGFFVIQWTLKIGHVRRKTVHQAVPTTSPSSPAIAGK
jgi:hypothetical protein